MRIRKGNHIPTRVSNIYDDSALELAAWTLSRMVMCWLWFFCYSMQIRQENHQPKEAKDQVFSNERNGYDKFTEDTFEDGTKFLSSDILFHQLNPNQTETSLCMEQSQTEPYNTLAVCLSPTSSLVVNEVQRQLPCLKILVGNEICQPTLLWPISVSSYWWRNRQS